MNLILCGFMGCGKTTVGQALAAATNRSFVDTDAMIIQEQGLPIHQIFDTRGEAYFRALEQEACRRLGGQDGLVISTGGGMLTVRQNVELLKQNGTIFLLDVPFPLLAERVGDGGGRPLFQDRSKAEALYDTRLPLYRSAANHVVDGSKPVDLIVDEILSHI